MNKQNRYLWALIVICAIGGTIGISPLLNSSQDENQTTFKIDMSYQSVTGNSTPTRVAHYGQVEQGSFFLQDESSPGYVMSPLIDTSVDFKVTGLIARAKVTQHFSNPTDQWLNGIYVFPLPENAAVDQLTMHIGERTIKASVQPKIKAKQMYQQAQKAGKKASLLEQSRPNLFTNAVANIGPNETISVTIEYQQLVHFDNGEFSLRFPTTITERYLPPTSSLTQNITLESNGWAVNQPKYKQQNITVDKESSEQTSHKVDIKVALNPGFPLAQIKSDVHPIKHQRISANQYAVTLAEEKIANQDFVLTWRATKTGSQPLAAHFTEQTKQGHYGLIMLIPPANDTMNGNLPREVIFVIDTSGSMAGASMEQAKLSLAMAVDDLTEADTFNIVKFDSTATTMSLSPLTANEQNKQKAKRYIEHLTANGGTEMLSALHHALAEQTPNNNNRLRQVIFITDGAVGNEVQLFDYIRKNLQHSRLFTVGIGAAPNSYFMTEAALMGKGTYTYVNHQQSVQEKMQQLFAKLTHPVLANLSINLPQDTEFYPKSLPDLYRGEPLLISYFSPEPLTHLQAQGEFNTHYWQQQLDLSQSGEQSGVATLWARRKIAQLERNKYMISSDNNIDQHILSLAMQHHIVSSMTSLVAIDVTPSTNKPSIDSQVNNIRPKGQLLGSLPQTATPAPLQMLFAMLFLSVALCIKLFGKFY